MKHIIIALAALILVTAGAWYWIATRTNIPTTLTITAPAGGELWQSGETHTIAWKTTGVPTSNKISITLRRLPPPPLPEEGQEFDPIVFTDLPNTGSATWTISDQYPGGTFILGASAYESVPVENPVSAESAHFVITHPKLAIDLYPLYTGASWNRSVVESVTIGTTTYLGASITSAPIDAGMDPGKVFTAFEQYYQNLMKAHGWHVSNALAAGGHVGGQTGYQNGPGTILVRFHVDYQIKPENAPSECPCDVTLSLFSTGNK